MNSTFLISSTKMLFHLLWVPLLSLIPDLCCPHLLSQGRGKRRASDSPKYFHCADFQKLDGVIIQFNL